MIKDGAENNKHKNNVMEIVVLIIKKYINYYICIASQYVIINMIEKDFKKYRYQVTVQLK